MTDRSVSSSQSPLWSLRGIDSFSTVRGRGVSSRNPFFVVTVLDRNDGLPPQLGMAVSKAVGNSVQRNRLRRRLRVVFTEHADQMLGWCVMVRALVGAADLAMDDVSSGVWSTTEKAREKALVKARFAVGPVLA